MRTSKSTSRVQFSPRAHARRDFFLHKNNDQRKARERDLATFDENRRAAGKLNPMRDKNGGTYGGREGTTSGSSPEPKGNFW